MKSGVDGSPALRGEVHFGNVRAEKPSFGAYSGPTLKANILNYIHVSICLFTPVHSRILDICWTSACFGHFVSNDEGDERWLDQFATRSSIAAAPGRSLAPEVSPISGPSIRGCISAIAS